MKDFMEVFGKLAFVLLAVWIVLAGLGMTDAPGKRRKHKGGRQCCQQPNAPRRFVSVTTSDFADDFPGSNRIFM